MSPPTESNEVKPLLSLDRVTKSFGGLVAVDALTLHVNEGRLAILMGPNGSGKTTLINLVSGSYTPESGRICFGGHDITGWSPHRIFGLGLVRTFQIPAPLTKLSVLENMLIAKGESPGESYLKAPAKRSWLGHETSSSEFAFGTLELVEMDSLWDKLASDLSGGQLKLLEIGRALMSGPKMILMDEPLSGLNPTLAHEIFSHIVELRRTLGVTFLVVEHRLEIALQYVDHAYVMSRGRLISEGKVSDVIEDPKVIEAYLGA